MSATYTADNLSRRLSEAVAKVAPAHTTFVDDLAAAIGEARAAGLDKRQTFSIAVAAINETLDYLGQYARQMSAKLEADEPPKGKQ